MRIALFSDIHGNIVGLEEVLTRISKIGADVIFALGDFLAVGPGGDDVIEHLLRREVRMIRGNWDEIFIDFDAYLDRLPSDVHDVVTQNYDWLLENTSHETRELIAGLPLTDELEVDPEHKLFVCHAAPDDPWSRCCSADVDIKTLREVYGGIEADVIAYGHYHNHHVINMDAKTLINVASVGMKSGGQSAVTILDYTKGRWMIQQYQVPYDTDLLRRLSHDRGVPNPAPKPTTIKSAPLSKSG